MTSKYLPLLSATLLAFSSPYLFCQSAPRLQVPFDDSVEPEISDSAGRPTIVGTVSYIDGVRGKAIVTDSEKGYVSFPLDQVFHPENGTLMVWMKPVDWEDGDGKFHFIASIASVGENRSRFLFYKYHTDSNLTFLVDRQTPETADLMQKDPGGWPLDWRHYTFTWTPTDLAMYVDGQLIGTMQRKVEAALPEDFKTMAFGFGGFVPLEMGKSAFDELRIYDQALSEDEILALYQQDHAAGRP